LVAATGGAVAATVGAALAVGSAVAVVDNGEAVALVTALTAVEAVRCFPEYEAAAT
jgi:hypothetical protein